MFWNLIGNNHWPLKTPDVVHGQPSTEEKSQCLFVVQVSEVGNDQKRLKMVQNVNTSFHDEIEEGLLEVILINEEFYPPVSAIWIWFVWKFYVRLISSLDFLYT